jgi:predicted nucleic acid-binding protein
MNACFADASYYIALLNPDDDAHEIAVSASQHLTGPIVTTTWVLGELAGRMSRPPNRQVFLDLLSHLRQDPAVELVPAEQRLFDAGIELYASRRDKEWSLVDCISFHVMHERSLTDALTTDHHFEQAGFRVLLK